VCKYACDRCILKNKCVTLTFCLTRLGWAADSSNKLRKAPISSMELKSAQILVSFISKQVRAVENFEELEYDFKSFVLQ